MALGREREGGGTEFCYLRNNSNQNRNEFRHVTKTDHHDIDIRLSIIHIRISTMIIHHHDVDYFRRANLVVIFLRVKFAVTPP